MLYMEKRVNSNNHANNMAAELGVRKQGEELRHRRGGWERDEDNDKCVNTAMETVATGRGGETKRRKKR